MTWENRLTFEVSSADPDSTSPAWVDLTLRIRDALQPVEIASGRQNDLDATEPGVFAILLDNSDDALTYGSTSSPYAAWWGPGRKCRLRETVAGVVMDLATGYLQVPTETIVTAGIEQRVSVSIVDRLGRLQASEPFISTLTAHVRYNGSTLVSCWPLADPSGSRTANNVIASTQALIIEGQVGTTPDLSTGGLLAFGSRSGPAGDDGSYAQWNTTVTSGVRGYRLRLVNRALAGVTAASGSFLAFAAWVYVPTLGDPAFQLLLRDTAGVNVIQVAVVAGVWQLTASNAGGFATINAAAPKTDAWQLLSVRIDCSATATVDFWIDGATYSSSLVGATTGTLDVIVLDGAGLGGSIAVAQIYNGAASGYDNAAHLAQYQMGLSGLERQATGDRIRAIAQYAGIPTAEYTSTVDAGCSVMRAATLAGQTPLQAMRDAERTEQGLLYVDGSGNLVFKDRRTLYNI